MRAILLYCLPQEESEFTLATNSGKLFSALWELSQEIRRHYKYDENQQTTWTEVNDMFYDILEGEGINLDNYA